ncbi:Threonine aldolase [Coemansia umbellata]|uniref:Threonine aldolase n=1 Tax=Coemansia umbellata TaxID=1424467 RepID=A0ABQ8PFD1_9FUNG|nr:Threonine aldolase [Coemansia umbellata]
MAGMVDTDMQDALRSPGKDTLKAELFALVTELYKEHKLLLSNVPAMAIVQLALHATDELWSNWHLRSDAVTKSTPEMLTRMVSSAVGDDVYGEDPTVAELENKQYECRGASLHTQAMMPPIGAHGNLAKKDVEENLILGHFLYHMAPTRLVCLENNFSGIVMPLDDVREISELCKLHKIPIHMDGARLWSASIATGHSLVAYAQHVDLLNLCLSKGMGCPVGALLVGSAEVIERARHFRKAFGGGWRQAGVLTAARLFAIENIWPTMEYSHKLAQRLALGLVDLGFSLALSVETNMVFISEDTGNEGAVVGKQELMKLVNYLKTKGIILESPYQGSIRIVLHYQITEECIEVILDAARELYNEHA